MKSKEIHTRKRLWVMYFGTNFKGLGLGIRIDNYGLEIDFLFFWLGIYR